VTELSKHSCRDEILQCNIKKILESDKTGHGYEHAIQTSEYAKTIIADEIIRFPDIQLDEDSIFIAALVHDIQRPFEKRNGDSHYGPVSLERIEELLLKSQFSKKEIKPILELVRVHDITSWEKLKHCPEKLKY
jgi:HD superfamily phosphodiesterase